MWRLALTTVHGLAISALSIHGVFKRPLDRPKDRHSDTVRLVRRPLWFLSICFGTTPGGPSMEDRLRTHRYDCLPLVFEVDGATSGTFAT